MSLLFLLFSVCEKEMDVGCDEAHKPTQTDLIISDKQGSDVTVLLHPLIVFNISDHVTRLRVNQASSPIGTSTAQPLGDFCEKSLGESCDCFLSAHSMRIIH